MEPKPTKPPIDAVAALLNNLQILKYVFQNVGGTQDFQDVTLATEDAERTEAWLQILMMKHIYLNLPPWRIC